MRLEFPHIFVYEASAGSGKTRRLAGRYVDFLLNYSGKTTIPFNFRNILAITFTNEAADQMRQQILRMLKTEALGRGRDSSSARQIVNEIIRNFSDFAVRTIDSFVHSLLVASSLELKLPPDYEIKPQPRVYLEYVLDSLLDEVIYDKDIAGLFLGFLNHFLIIEGGRHWNPKKILLNLLVRFYQEENNHAKPFREIDKVPDLNKIEKELKSRIEQLLLMTAVKPDFNKRFINALRSAQEDTGLGFLKSLSRYMHKTLLPGEGILHKSARLDNLDLVKSWQELNAVYDNYAHAFVWLRYNFYLRVFSKFRERLENFKQEKRIVFLDELNKKARQFLTNEGFLPAEIYYKLSSVLYHYLIDEFQDTSVLQWENIQALIEDALSKGGSLFYVGDKKQAIYHFRGGKVELFDLIKRRFRKRVAKIYDEVLIHNYRSRKNIVKFNNAVFSQENLNRFLGNFPYISKEYHNRILEVFKDSQQKPALEDSQGGYVRLQVLQGENKQELQDQLNIKLKEVILTIKKRFNYRDILILVRDNQEVESIADFLLNQEFPVCASRTISIRQNYLIGQIIALLRFLNSPIDNLCFASFILGDAFSKTTKLQTETLRLWLEQLRIDGQMDVLYTKFRCAFPDIWEEYLQYLFNAVGFLPVYDLVKTILIKFRIEENFPHLCGFTRRLLEILNELEEQGKNSLSDFLEWFENAEEEDLFIRLPSGLDAIKILTIHKAKGLTSAVVILPYAALEVKVGEVAFEAPKIVYERSDGLHLLYPQKDICRSQPELNSMYQKEYFQSLLDELNCLYVGMTRAAYELYIFLPRKINRSKNLLVSLLFKQQQNSKEIGKIATYSIKRRAGESKRAIQLPPTLPKEIFKEMLKDQLVHPGEVISSERRYLIKRGEVLHSLLAEIDSPDFLVKNEPLFIQRIKHACHTFNYPDSGAIIRCLSDFFHDSGMRQFYNPNFKAFNEQEVVNQYGNLRRIDRLVFAEDKIIVIEYKTGEEYQQEHAQQVEEYIQLVKQIYPDRLCQGWLIYLDSKKIIPIQET